MFNMATMAADECRTDDSEKNWQKWLARCEHLVGRSLAEIEAHSDLWDMYLDGATPDEAIDEMLTQALFCA
ncbi:hypothetical protein [Pseudomonas asiatica]|uniref:hypothetical protein n=1 Tax=Pseudomonas asiatica TaxID=2219225 RepID=UPI003B92B206